MTACCCRVTEQAKNRKTKASCEGHAANWAEFPPTHKPSTIASNTPIAGDPASAEFSHTTGVDVPRPTCRILGGMKRRSAAALIVLVAAISSIATMAAQKQVQKSTVYPWESTQTPNEWGAVRRVMRASTPTLEELEIHVSTLDAGKSPHAPHQHAYEELLIVKDGTLETFQSGTKRRVGPGGIIFQASNELHNVTNVGTTPATYFVIEWTVPHIVK